MNHVGSSVSSQSKRKIGAEFEADSGPNSATSGRLSMVGAVLYVQSLGAGIVSAVEEAPAALAFNKSCLCHAEPTHF